jgi:hypothetical protein
MMSIVNKAFIMVYRIKLKWICKDNYIISSVNNDKYFMLSTHSRDRYKFYGRCLTSKIIFAGKKSNSAQELKKELKKDGKIKMTEKSR